ncbi:MAG: hypothetical protein JW797_17450 [Bradymonadales bacterium]|nr:hypothetical protein [Bradymonadales bacterium]
MTHISFLLKTGLIGLFCSGLLLACELEEDENGNGGPCSFPTTTVATDQIVPEALVVREGTEVQIGVWLASLENPNALGSVRLAVDQTLMAYARDAQSAEEIAIIENRAAALAAQGDDTCAPGARYVATATTTLFDDDLVITLSGPTDFEGSQLVFMDNTTVTSTPTQVHVGQPFEIGLSGNLPTLAGLGVNQSWWFEVSGSCITNQEDGFTIVEDSNQVGSDQQPTTDNKVSATIPSTILTSGSSGCEVSAVFVISTTAYDCFTECIQGNFTGRVRIPFTFQLLP